MFLLELEAHPTASNGQLNAWYSRYHAEPEFSGWLVEAIISQNEALERNGSWLLKKHLEKGAQLSLAEWHAICEQSAQFEQWELLLHLCQALALNPPLAQKSVPLIVPFLRRCTTHKKPFVRAWGVTAFHELAKQFVVLRNEAVRVVETAVSDPAKSVQARIRNLK